MKGWNDTTIGECCTIVSGSTPKTGVPDYWDGDIPWASPSDLSKLTTTSITSTGRCLTAEGLASCGATLLPMNSVLMSSRASIGLAAVNKVPMATNQGFKSLIPKPGIVDHQFLYWWIVTHRPAIERLGRGATFKEISKPVTSAIKISLPPIDEQRRIAAILDKADEVRAKRRASAQVLGTLTQSIFIEMFGDPNKNPKGWPLDALGDLAANEDSVRVPVKLEDRSERSGPYPYYGASGIIDYVDGFLFEGERLLIGEDGANLATRSSPVAFIASGKYWVNNHAHVLADNGRAELRFLERLIESIDLKPYLSGSAQPKLNQASLARIQVIVPPLSEQRAFAHRVAQVGAQQVTVTQSGHQADALFSSLQQRAFQGAL